MKFPRLSVFPGKPETGVKKEQASGPVHAPFNRIGCWHRPRKASAVLPSMCTTEAIILHVVVDFSMSLFLLWKSLRFIEKLWRYFKKPHVSHTEALASSQQCKILTLVWHVCCLGRKNTSVL